jgi:hypothetical protein
MVDGVILFFNVMIIPKVFRAFCLLGYQRIYMLLLERSERVQPGVWSAFMLKVEKHKFDGEIYQGVESSTCSICMSQFEEGDAVAVGPCPQKHTFHYSCLENWVKVKL